MICVVLAGGFGTRIRSVIGESPKGLIEVGGISLISRLSHDVDQIPSIDSLLVVSNSLHFEPYLAWCRRVAHECRLEISVLNNGVTTAEQRLGAIGDLEFAVNSVDISSPILVAAADCYYDFSLEGMCRCFQVHGGSWVATMREDNLAALVEGAEVETDSAGVVVYMAEKPAKPRSNLGALPFYIFERTALKLLPEFMKSGGNPDSPGRFAEWLFDKQKLSAFEIDSSFTCEDLGTPESYFRRIKT